MTRNQQISKTADVYFLPPESLQIVRYNFETALKDYVEIHVALYTTHKGKLVPYTSCENLNFELDFTHDIFHIEQSKNSDAATPPLHSNACRVLHLRATTLGSTQFRVRYTFADKILKDEVSLVVFDKLDILRPVSNELVLPIGSSHSVIYFNGPQKIFNIEAELNKITKFDKKIVDVHEIHNEHTKSKHIFHVLCKKVGETALTFETYNSLLTSNYVPYISKYITTIYCVKPRFINLYTREKLRESCPLKLKNSLMHVKRSDDDMEIGIEVLDAQHRKLMNITSLAIDLHFIQTDDKAYTGVTYKRQTEDELIEGTPIPLRDYLITAVPDLQNNYKIKVAVVSYDRKVLNSFSISPESPEFGIKKVSIGKYS